MSSMIPFGVHLSRSPLVLSALWASAMLSIPVTAHGQEVLHDFVGDTSSLDTGFYRFDALGDVNGDGVSDFIYGCPGPHMHWVHSGSNWATLARYRSTIGTVHDSHGLGVAGIGSWDGDAIPDYAVGAPNVSIQQFYEGAVRIFSGATHDLIQEISEHIHDDNMGRDVYGLGDLDGDGYSEFATIGTYGNWVRIYSGPNGSLLRTHVDPDGNEADVAPYGDYDGDGGIDYLIGHHSYSAPPPLDYCGRVVLYSGKTGLELLTMVGLRPHDVTGVSISAAGDWNGDGIGDVAAGAPGVAADFGGDKCGVYVFSGADGSVLRFFDGVDFTDANSGFGYAIASGKDVNGDGFPDLLVGAPAERGEPPYHVRRGAVFLLSGKTGALLWQHRGREWTDYKLGRLVYMLDDHDGDGLDEWVVSDPSYTAPGGTVVGRITIYRGSVGDVQAGCPTTPNSATSGARLFAAGPISLRDNLLALSVELAPPLAVGMFVYGQASTGAPFGEGQLCVGGALVTAGYLAMNPQGAGLLPLDLFHAPFTHGPGALHAGDSRAFQYLYRDPGTGDRNASDSIVIQFVP